MRSCCLRSCAWCCWAWSVYLQLRAEPPSGGACAVSLPVASACAARVAPLASAAQAPDPHSLASQTADPSGLHFAAMLHAGCAPVRFRGGRAGSDCVERHGVNSLAAPGRVGWQQFRRAVRRCSLVVPVPDLVPRGRRKSVLGATLRVRSRGERAAEVRLALFSTVLSPHEGVAWRRRRRRLALPSRCG